MENKVELMDEIFKKVGKVVNNPSQVTQNSFNGQVDREPFISTVVKNPPPITTNPFNGPEYGEIINTVVKNPPPITTNPFIEQPIKKEPEKKTK